MDKKTVSSTNDLNGLTEGITNNGIEQGEITLTITNNNIHHLYYNCQFHSSMAGMIDVYNENNDYVKCNKTTFKNVIYLIIKWELFPIEVE